MNPLHSLVAHKGHFSLAKCVCELNNGSFRQSRAQLTHPLPLSDCATLAHTGIHINVAPEGTHTPLASIHLR